MSPAVIEDAGVAPDSQRKEKKHKRDKSEHKKKRAREEDAVAEETARKPKKSRGEKSENFDAAPENEGAAGSKHKKKHRDRRNEEEQETERPDDSVKKSKKAKLNGLDGDEPQEENGHNLDTEAETNSRKKSKKHKHKNDQVAADQDGAGEMNLDTADLPGEPGSSRKRKHKGKKSKKKKIEDEPTHQDTDSPLKEKRKSKDKKKKKHHETLGNMEDDAMDLDDAHASSEPQEDQIFPFFTQAVSLYVPFFPNGFEKPLSNVAAQHLDPLLNHYSPTLRGVLLSYSNLNLSDRPVKASVVNPPTDETPALLRSVDEYAVGFGWLTFDAQLFVPSRGKWMEGVLQLQNEGHVGVVCWSKFNASIEAKRLPKGWKWVDLAKAKKSDMTSGSDSLPSPDSDAENATENQEEEDMLDGEDLQVVEQMHTTGYWVDERGRKVSGKLRFRIKNFDVGLAGDYGYLSIEGTCLDEDAERALAAEEREAEKKRRGMQNARGLLRPMSRRVPEFSMTKLGREEQEEDSGQRTVVYKGSRPGTPDD